MRAYLAWRVSGLGEPGMDLAGRLMMPHIAVPPPRTIIVMTSTILISFSADPKRTVAGTTWPLITIGTCHRVLILNAVTLIISGAIASANVVIICSFYEGACGECMEIRFLESRNPACQIIAESF